ncbi:MAG TPA: secondary thiamine-phosphate synthase enzyme YjbQ [Methanomassiliicoccales archaeon]|nr:secondary thiamine-phosphate synthase enzyme YjbQ [Methanomassiliicoccales archaeon]
MVTFRRLATIGTKGEGDVVDITELVEKTVAESGMRQGVAIAFTPHSTAAVVTIENEPGLREDLSRALQRNFPSDIEYQHHLRWGDGNGHSHVRSTFLGASVSLPFDEGRLEMGRWQQVALLELDVHERQRELIVQLLGE